MGFFIFVRLRPDIDLTGVSAWLAHLGSLVRDLQAKIDDFGNRTATAAVGFSPAFYGAAESPRFEGVAPPAGFTVLPEVPGVAAATDDVLVYLVTTREAIAAELLDALWQTRPDVVALHVERGYQRDDGTEPFGYRDGVRNVARTDRGNVGVRRS